MTFVHRYERLIEWIVSHAGGSDKFAHMSAGLTIWLLSAMILKRPLDSVRPLLIVVAAEAANEWLDRLAHGSWRWMDTRADIAATLFWPVVIALSLRFLPALRGKKSR